MIHRTVDYGIDLGTTNSAIARMADGAPQVVKNGEQSETTPSCVYCSKAGQWLVGEAAARRMRMDLAQGLADRAQCEFKTKMGTDEVYRFPSVSKAFTPEELSSQVLAALKGYVRDDDVRAAVIAVPAAFGQNQIEATQRAAELAGLEQIELIPEPLAASMAYAVDARHADGRWLVFDLGGGTFDAVLMKMHEGIMKVVDIGGDSRLGGKDMDNLIVDQVILPELRSRFALDRLCADPQRGRALHRLLKTLYAEEAKIRLTRDDSTQIEVADELMPDDRGRIITDVCMTLTRKRLDQIVSPLVDRAIKLSAAVCARNNIEPSALSAVLLVGGPTLMPCVRDAIRTRLCADVDSSVDPMTSVARGAALYASTVALRAPRRSADPGVLALTLAYPETTVENEVTVGLRVESADCDGFSVEIAGSDGRWKSGRTACDNNACAVTVPLAADRPNCFTVAVFDKQGNRRQCEPEAFTVIQGIRIDNPPLPFDICVEVVSPDDGPVLKPVARRGDTLPTTGIVRNLKTRSPLRAGDPDDRVTIPVYEGEGYTRPLYNRYIGELCIRGDQVNMSVPQGSDVTVTMRIDSSRRKTVSAYIDCIDRTFDGVMPPLQKTSFDGKELDDSLDSARQRVEELAETLRYTKPDDVAELTAELDRVSVQYELAGIERDGLETAADRIRELHRKLDAVAKNRVKEIAAGRLRGELDIISATVREHGSPSQNAQLGTILDKARLSTDATRCEDLQGLLAAGRALYWEIVGQRPSFWINAFTDLSRTLCTRRWSDPLRARRLVDRGKEILSKGYDVKLKEIVGELWEISRSASNEPMRVDVLEAR